MAELRPIIDNNCHKIRQLEQILLNAIHSGDPIEVTPEMIEDVKQRLRERAGQRKGAKR